MNKNARILLLLAALTILWVGCKTGPTTPINDPQILAEYDTLKLKITQEGIYRLALADLGWDASAFENIALTHKGQPVPIWLDDDADHPAIIFYGQPSDSTYTPENIYIVQQDPAQAQLMQTSQRFPASDAAGDVVISSVHIEENQLYTPKVEEGNPWHWSKIIAPQAQTITIDLPQAIDGPAHLSLTLWGATDAPVSPNHHVRVSVNAQVVGEAAWDGLNWYMLEAPIPAGVLKDGTNEIVIHATGETAARIDIVNLDWLEIDYPKRTNQLANQEFFRFPKDGEELTGFSGPLTIFEINSPTEISRLEIPTDPEEGTALQGKTAARYVIVNPDGYLRPAQILPTITIPDLRAEHGADYLAIGHPDLLTALQPLLSARRDQGLSALAIPLEAIYDQFNNGMAEPQAIQKFLAFAVTEWQTAPQYILLIGDSSYDYYGYQQEPAETFLPTFMVPTVYGGQTGSDVLITQINADPWPDLAVGRVPARNPEQVEVFVDKTLAFEQNSAEAGWQNAILAVADGQEAIFQEDAQRFLEQFPAEYRTQLIAPEAGAQNTNQQIANELGKGVLLTAYFGHGSIDMWGKDSLFTIEDSAALDNASRLPIVLNFTCLTGLFIHPTQESLAENMLFNPNGGAVAVLAPTSPTLPNDQTFLSNALITALLQNSNLRLGQITLYAWQQVPTYTPSALDVMQTFLLFGDPALQLPTP